MKKLLLLSALAVSAMASNAEGMGDYFKFTFNGEELKDGQEIVISKYEDNTEWEDGYTYEGAVMVENVQGKDAKLYGALEYTDQPSYKMIQDALAGGRPSEWGVPMFCFTGNCFAGNEEVAGDAVVTVNAAAAYPQSWDIHLGSVKSLTTVSKYTLFLAACDENEERIDDAEMTINITITADPNQGQGAVNEIEAGNAATAYFNLQGQKVNNPEKGIYLVKRGGKFTKEVVR